MYIENLKKEVYALYEGVNLPFHGINHIDFVRARSLEFSKELSCDSDLLEAAALLHDLNYLQERNSKVEKGKRLRKKLLLKAHFSSLEIEKIERIIVSASTSKRGAELTNEAKCLSDADTLFKSLPVTPILLASKYMEENVLSLQELAEKIVSHQNKLMDKGIYFYTDAAKKYLPWARTNLELWNNVLESLEENDIRYLVQSVQ